MVDLYVLAGRFKLLYSVPPAAWLLIAAVFLGFWTLLMIFLNRRAPSEQCGNPGMLRRTERKRKLSFTLNMILMLAGLLLILLVTFVRRESSVHQVILFPLRVLFGKKAPGDYWQVSIMNIVLYVPFACGLAFCLKSGRGRLRRHPALASVLICLLLSLAAETGQFLLGAGTAEVDDVLMNTLGAVLGCLPCYLCCRDGYASASGTSIESQPDEIDAGNGKDMK